MIARHPSAGSRRKRKHPRTIPGQRAGSGTMDSTDRDLLAHYQQQIMELEGTLTNLRDRLKAQTEQVTWLLASHTNLADLFENAPVGYVVHDRAGFVKDCNRAAATLLGLKTRRGPGASVTQFLPQEQLELWLTHMHTAAVHLRATTDFTLRTPNGRETPVQVVTAPVPAPLARAPRTFRTALTNINQRYAAEAVLAQTRQNYHALINTIEGIVWEAEAGTLEVTFVSGYAERLLGYALAEWSRPDFWPNHIHVADRERVVNQVLRAVARREKLALEYRVVAADRRVLWLHDNLTVLERGKQLKLLGVAIDVTERHNAQDNLLQANELLEQRVAERTAELRETVTDLEAFSYSLSHDMRAPLRAMQGFASFLEEMAGNKLSPTELDFLRRIQNSAGRLDGLVQDVLKYSRVARAPLELKSISLEPLLRSILHDYPALAPARTRVEIRRPLLPVCGHEAFITQALSNLLTNAVKFVPPGRKPRVRVWTEAAPRQDAEPARVRIWVEDNGLGIAPEDQKRIFHIFERIHPVEKYEGTGIGLAIVQKAVQRMGGRVGVESDPGRGSKFWVELPRPVA